jgi:ubiquinone/menaquinone biosynthesis C-methylase UbiE
MLELQHELRLSKTRDERARQNFVSALRGYVLNTMANAMRARYERRVLPAFRRRHGRKPRDGSEVHRALRADDYFRFYSSTRVTAQDMVWQSVIDPLEEQREKLLSRARALEMRSGQGSLELDPTLVAPEWTRSLDVHLMPGNYEGEYEADDLAAGALYDNGLAVFSFGLMGQNLDDIGQSIARFMRLKHPDWRPRGILDLGCTVGHNTGSWKDVYAEAEVHGIDVAAPCLRYAHARAQAQSREIHFHQMNAERLAFPDASFDLVFSSMFLHEVPPHGIARILREAHRVLRPGGLMLHMELPPNGQLSAYDAFYLDWDSEYNNEPFYKQYRDQDPRELCQAAGFARSRYVQFVIPSIGWYGPEVHARSARQRQAVDSDKTGRLADGIRWYCFGACK